MKSPTSFDCVRSTNYQLHNKICQEDQYNSYLHRIKQIVEKRPALDGSPKFYMQFLHKSKEAAKGHQFSEENTKIQLDNKHLLNKIIRNKSRKVDLSIHSYHLAMYEKRHREIEKINQENKKIAKRINAQNSVVKKGIIQNNFSHIKAGGGLKTEKKNITGQGWNCSPLKERRLPKLTQFYADEKKEDQP